MKLRIVTLLVCFGLSLSAYAAQPISTLTAETANNTSACSSSSYGGGKAVPSYCTVSQISGLTTFYTNTSAQTQILNPLLGHVSNVSIKHSYLYPNANTRIIAGYQPWFGPEGSTYPDCSYYPAYGTGNESNLLHPCTGYSENNLTGAIAKQHTTMHNVGFTDVSPDWYGNCDGNGCNNGIAQTFLNQTVIDEASDLSTRTSGYLRLMIMIDKGLIESGMTATTYSGGSSGCNPSTDGNTCVIPVLEAAFDYINHNWGRQSYYSIDPVSGYPMVLTYIDESKWPNVTWTGTGGVWPTIYSYMSKYATPYKIVSQWHGSFSEWDGAYAWPQDLSYSNSNPGTQFCWAWPGPYNGGCDYNYDYIAAYYSSAKQATGKIQMGTFYIGFDGSNNNYNNGILARQCGQLLQFLGGSLSTGEIAKAGYSSTKQLPWILFATWNDYGEGTNIENGVDNCWRIPKPTMNNTTVSWNVTATSGQSQYASSTTVDHFKIWYGSGAGDLALSQDSIKPSGTNCTPGTGVINCSFDLSKATYPPPTGHTWYIYIEQIGAALVFDEINGGGNGNGGPVQHTF